jgi:hypothetical protein
MGDIHIDDFNKDCAKIFGQLFRTFPRPQLLFVEDICGPDSPDEYGLHSDRHSACFSTLIWLEQAGYLRYSETVQQEAVDQAVLTHKSFTLLTTRANFLSADEEQDSSIAGSQMASLPPSVLEARQSNIHRVRTALKSGASLQINQAIQQLLLQARHFK